MNPRLYPYQQHGAKWLAAKGCAILADEMGVGKTSQSIAACDLIGAKRILVICPGVARENWCREFEEWQTQPRTLGAIYTTKVMPGTDVIVVSYAMLTSLVAMRYLLSLSFDVLILDESHLLKNDAAGRSRSVYGNKFDRSRGLASKAKRVWLLSGTIMPNHPGELWTHCSALFPDVVLNAHGGRMTYRHWTEYYCRTRPGGEKIVGRNPATAPELVRKIKPHVLRRTMTQVHPDMPPLRLSQYVLRPDALPPMSAELEETAKVVAAAYAKASNGDSEGARAALAAVDEMHLASLRKWTGIAKAPAIGEVLNQELAAGLNKIVVFAYHKEVFEVLLKAIPGSVAIYGPVPQGNKPGQRQYLIDGFQGKIPGFKPRVLLCHIDIASTAITLTAANHVAMAEQTWVVKDTLQAVKRVHRLGQKLPVFARVFSLTGSVDEKIGKTLVRKARETSAFEREMAA